MASARRSTDRNRTLVVAGLGGAILAASARTAHAHEKWVSHGLVNDFDRTLFEQPVAGNVIPVIAVGLLVAVVVWLARRFGPALDAKVRGPRVQALRPWLPAVVGWTLGASLLISAVGGQLFAPDLVPLDGFWTVALLGLQVVCAVALLTGVGVQFVGWCVVGMFGIALLFRPFAPFDGHAVSVWGLLNYVEIAAVGVYGALAGRPRGRLLDWPRGVAAATDPALRDRAVGALRIGLGATLVILGVQKWLVPELPMGVVQNYGETIYEPFRSLVSPEAYVLGAALVEATVGIVLMLGCFTRIVSIVLVALFACTAAIFTSEILGHLALVGPVVVLLVEGGGAWRVERLRWPANTGEPRVAASHALAMGCALLLVYGTFFGALGHATARGSSGDTTEGSAVAGWTTCPVCLYRTTTQPGVPHADYGGTRYYLCCQSCALRFEGDPARYSRPR